MIMDYYWFIEAIVGIIVGLLIALCTKKAKDVTYGKLDKAGMILNVVLLAVYTVMSPFYLFIGSISRPAYEGFLGVVGGIVSVISASTAFFGAVGLGASVALRKRGKSKLSFIVQFAGFAGMGLMLLFFFLFYGNLLKSIN